MIKIIFLDIDGVLNNELFYCEQSHEEQYLKTGNVDDIDIRNMKLLNDLIASTDAKVVVSSTWRIGNTPQQMQSRLEEFGFKGEVIGVTPWLDRNEYMLRGNEIYQWLDENEDILGETRYTFDKYVILDDDCDMLLYQKDNFIHVNPYVGLTPRDIWKAEYILNGKLRDNVGLYEVK